MTKKDNGQHDETLERILHEVHALEEEQTAPDETVETIQQAPVKKRTDQRKKDGRSIWFDLAALLLRIGWITFILAILLLVICGVTVNNANHMAPAFHEQDVVIYYRLAKDIQAGEVVVFRGERNQPVVGRVVAKGGDTVDITETGLQINGYHQVETYASGDTLLFEGGASLPVTLRPGEYFILFDERAQSGDSRTLGPVSADRILGRVMVSIRQRDF